MQLSEHVVAYLRRLTCSHPGSRVQFRLPDASDFYVLLSSAEAGAASHPGEACQPTLVLELAKATLSAILEGRLSARHAFLLGDIHYSGDRELAAALADLFPARDRSA
ncbi:SCP2 sterol-binding domain-containing protein [Microbulbifer sp. SAOS-129_SWC]|uniref:SCP2 sterol-binding domain-containing protein n=1 Tax=Microbulbifer sp. SAOS-129_SWC TaxID=3145235 RepID=UPI0032173958